MGEWPDCNFFFYIYVAAAGSLFCYLELYLL